MRSIVEYALKYAQERGAAEVHVSFSRSRGYKVEVVSDAISNVSYIQSARLSVIAIVGKKLGAASTNSLDEREVKKCVERAVDLAKATTENPRWSGLPEPREYPVVEGTYDKRIAELEPEEAVELLKTSLEEVKETSRKVVVMQGLLSASKGEVILANSRGVWGEDRGTSVSAYLVTVAKESGVVGSFASEDAVSRSLDVDFRELGRRAAEKALESLHLKPVESFKGSLILDYEVAAFLFLNLARAYSGDSVWRGSSPLRNRLGEQIAVEAITVVDNGVLPRGISTSKFDAEGSPRQKTLIIEKGVLKTFINNSFTANILGMEPTGNASSLLDVAPSNTVIEGGDYTIEEIIRETKKGLFLSRFSGKMSSIDGIVSGSAKQAFLVENGEKKYPVRECMVVGNLYEFLKNISAVSKERKFKWTALTPVIKIENVNIVTK
ncbi:MAG TPA: TldD/PmbA family protein [Thermoprotei archaeon]|nr:TldD/PmbA family protein [Thermoprotei archaeon]